MKKLIISFIMFLFVGFATNAQPYVPPYHLVNFNTSVVTISTSVYDKFEIVKEDGTPLLDSGEIHTYYWDTNTNDGSVFRDSDRNSPFAHIRWTTPGTKQIYFWVDGVYFDNFSITVSAVWYADNDGDGFGDPNTIQYAITQPSGYVNDNTDECPTEYGISDNNGCPEVIVIDERISNENYIYTIVPQKPVTDVVELEDLENDEKIESIQYYDGLGRPKQTVAKQAGGDKEDIVTHVGYDDFGRQAKEFLPYANNSGQLSIRTGDIAAATNTFYQNKYPEEFTGVALLDVNAYSEKHFEASPLNRVLEQAAPGLDWGLDKSVDTDHTIKFEYQINTHDIANQTNPTNDNVRLYTVAYINGEKDAPKLELSTTNSGYYLAGELYKNTTKDENWLPTQTYLKDHTTEEFKNKQGQVILKRTYNNNELHDTYYIYDDFGNLTYVLPPKAEANTDKPDATELAELCYQYIYDYRNRLIEKKIPGKDWEYIVYDKLDRPILTQDANMRKANSTNNWLFTKYDVFGRVVYTGLLEDDEERSILQNNANNSIKQFEYKDVSLNLGNATIHYTNESYPSNNIKEIYTINYYDNYTNLLPLNYSAPTTIYNQNITGETKGLPTVSKVRVLDSSNWITTISYYNKKARPIYIYSANDYLGTVDIVESKLDFIGRVLETRSSHKRWSSEAIVTIEKFIYDHQGRLISQSHCTGKGNFTECNDDPSITTNVSFDTTLNLQDTTTTKVDHNSITLLPDFNVMPSGNQSISFSIAKGNEELIAANTYDDLGQLESKRVGGKITNTDGLQQIDYTYNIRGWLKTINQDTYTDNDLFNFSLAYNNPTGGTALYNGNISQASWNSLSENPFNTSVSNQYTYNYDALNRIVGAKDNTGHYNLGGYDIAGNLINPITYDKNGNIKTLSRKGHLNNSTLPSFGVMDNLVYDYGINNGNKLLKVTDTGLAPTTVNGQFQDRNTSADDYTYDANGNLTKDLNKNIEGSNNTDGILYNHLNLPTEVRFGNTNKIKYIYDATGVKIAKQIIESGKEDKYTLYAGNYIYEDFEVQFFNHSEGYVKPNNTGGFNYVYQYKDHLGNVRLSYTDTNNDGIVTASTEIIEESNYYPFGLKHKGYNNVTSSNGNSTAQKMGFGGKELQDELGLGWYDVSARNYDPALGRWMNLDPLAEQMRRHSPYNFGFDNPIYFQDYDGMAPTGCCGNWNPVAGIGEGIARSMTSTMNNITTSVTNTINSIGSGVQSFVQDNKNTLLDTAKVIQTVGDAATNAGLIGATAGAAISATGIGAVPGAPTVAGGLAVAGVGSVVSLVGDGLELATNLISGDLGKSGENVAVVVAGEVAGNVIDKIIPGPNPDLTPVAKEIIQTTTEVVKNTVSNETKKIVKDNLEQE